MKLLLSIIALTLTTTLSSQSTYAPCGTAPVKSTWLKKYQASPQRYEQRSADLLYVPLSINIVARDDGAGRMREAQLYQAILTLNADFEESDIQFFLRKPIGYINKTEWSNHQDILVGAEMMFANNIENAINCYFVPEAAGNCGYNLPYAGVAVAIGCAGAEDHTWAHEIGHNLALPHPFIGWEGNVTCTSSGAANWTGPSPERLTYDYTYFQDTLIIDTLIIDTAYVELVDGSNCEFAADGFCDTKPDYIACRWPCDGDGNSLTRQIDPTGAEFVSDGSLIMSYASDECSNRFSEEQMAAMRANLMDEKPGHLTDNGRPADIVSGEARPIKPVVGVEVFYQDVQLEWEPVDNAMYYLVEVSRRDGFTSFEFDTIVSGTSTIAQFDNRPGRELFWRVRPFTSHQFDYQYSPVETFVLSDILSNTQEISTTPILSVRNTLVASGEDVYIEAEGPVTIRVVDMTGSMIANRTISTGSHHLNTSGWPKGVYLLEARQGLRVETSRIICQ